MFHLMELLAEKWPEPYRSYTADFTHLLSTYLRQGQKTIVVLWPFRKQIIPSEHAAALARLQASGHAEQDHHPRALNVFIAGIAREAGALVVDATDTFASDARPQHFYLPGDSHLSADGHARLAELLAQAVTDQARN